MNEEDLKRKVVELSTELEELKAKVFADDAAENFIDYTEPKVRSTVEAVIAQLEPMRSADIHFLYQEPFFEGLKTNYARAIIAAACVEVTGKQKSKRNELWETLMTNGGVLTNVETEDE